MFRIDIIDILKGKLLSWVNLALKCSFFPGICQRKITFLGKFGFKMLLFFQVFVKGRRDDFMAHPEEALHWGSEVFPSENDFQMMAKSYLRSGFFYRIDGLTWL